MSLIVTTDYDLLRVTAPNLPLAPTQYDSRYHEQFNNVLRLYFNQLDKILGQLMANTGVLPVAGGGTGADAFGRLRVSEPFTLFDSQSRYAPDPHFNVATTGTGTTTFLANEAAVKMEVTAGGVGSVTRQSYRVFPYQPGKGLLILATFVMDASDSLNLTQRVGYYNDQNGVFFQRIDGTYSFVLRSYVTGTVSDARTVNQADWNGDKLDGTGPSGLTLDATKAQILWMDFEWLGVGSVRCGFIINGEYILCHTFNNANEITSVYMTTAILPMRYEIKTTTSAVAASMKAICCTVISEGGYQQMMAPQVARRTTALGSIGTTFLPLVSIRLASDSLGAVVLPQEFQVLPTTSGDYEIALVKNATLTGAAYNTTDFRHVDYDVSATAMTGGTIVQVSYTSATNKSGTSLATPSGYNFDLQLGATIGGTSDVYTLGVRVLSGTGSAIGSLSFIDLTD